MWLDHYLRRFGIVVLVLLFPTLGIPFLVLINLEEVPAMSLVVILMGGTASFAIYVGLLLLTIRAYRNPIWARIAEEVDSDVDAVEADGADEDDPAAEQ